MNRRIPKLSLVGCHERGQLVPSFLTKVKLQKVCRQTSRELERDW